MFWLLSAVALAVSASCKQKGLPERSPLGYVLGPTNDISIFAANDPRLALYDFTSSAVLITTTLTDGKLKFCSGTLVAPAAGEKYLRILTNHHCFAATDKGGKATDEILGESCLKTKVFFDYVKGKTVGGLTADCAPGSLRTSFEMDLAVFSLNTNLPAKYRPLSIYGGDLSSLTGKPALVIHYPDLELSRESPGKGFPGLPVAAYTNNDCRILGTFSTQEAVLDRTLPFGLRHTCDLIQGSSGSALFDPTSGTIYGVNWGGIQINQTSGISTDNVATSAPFVKQFLAQKMGENLVYKAESLAGQPGVGRAGAGADAVEKKSEDSGERKARSHGQSCAVVGAPEHLATRHSRILLFWLWLPVAVGCQWWLRVGTRYRSRAKNLS
jgi:hypothetical protein